MASRSIRTDVSRIPRSCLSATRRDFLIDQSVELTPQLIEIDRRCIAKPGCDLATRSRIDVDG